MRRKFTDRPITVLAGLDCPAEDCGKPLTEARPGRKGALLTTCKACMRIWRLEAAEVVQPPVPEAVPVHVDDDPTRPEPLPDMRMRSGDLIGVTFSLGDIA